MSFSTLSYVFAGVAFGITTEFANPDDLPVITAVADMPIEIEDVGVPLEAFPEPEFPEFQPEGPKVNIEFRECEGDGVFAEVPVVWAPGQCQFDPMGGGSVRLECVKDGSLWVRVYEDGLCESLPQDNLFLRHGWPMFRNEEECTQRVFLPNLIRDACEGPRPTARPTAPAPKTAEPTPAPVPKVECTSYNDPHMTYFDRTNADNMNRGHFLFYKTDVLEVQVRHGPYLTLDPSHFNYDAVSTNNAYVLTGSWVCGAVVEMEAFKPEDPRSKVGSGIMRIFKDGVQREYESLLEMQAAQDEINDLVCGGFKFDLTYAENKFGPIFEIEKAGRSFRWQVRPFGINIWITFGEDMYLLSDSGMCTKRGDYNRHLECSEILFRHFPEGHGCAEEKERDRTIPAPEDPECDAELREKATEICGACPDVVEPEDCVVETCLLGGIEFAKAQVVACGIKPPAKNTCGRLGAIRRKGDSVKVAKKQASACACRDACQAAGGFEWQFKAKRGRCRCHKGSEGITFKQGDVTVTKKRIVGLIEGSSATIRELA